MPRIRNRLQPRGAPALLYLRPRGHGRGNPHPLIQTPRKEALNPSEEKAPIPPQVLARPEGRAGATPGLMPKSVEEAGQEPVADSGMNDTTSVSCRTHKGYRFLVPLIGEEEFEIAAKLRL